MDGIIFMELHKYVRTRHGEAAWSTLVESSGLKGKLYMGLSEYPDREAVALISAASTMTKTPVDDILQDFGAFIAPELVSLYSELVDPKWKTLDLIEHTEDTIHRVVRLQKKGARPPALLTRRVAPNEVVITYGSPRKMCGIAKGIARGLGTHYGERVEISESVCMNKGDSVCEISVRVP
jgi:predicted hydrocarbon binding protein